MERTLALPNIWAPFSSKSKISASAKKSGVSQIRFWLSVGLITANAILLMSYIYGVNDYANKGYEISVLQKNLAALQTSNKQINLKVSEAASMVTIQTDFLNSNFVPAGTPQFLQFQDQQLTQR